MTKITQAGPETIFLQPECCVDWSGEGRQWCEHDVWGDDCEDHSPAVEYVRKDIANAHREAAVKEAALSSSQPDLVEQFERIITTWAYAYDIDGAARNDLFKRLRTNAQPAPDAGLVVDEQILLILDEQIALWHSSNCELHEWLGWTEAEFHDWVTDPTKIPRLPQYALTGAGEAAK